MALAVLLAAACASSAPARTDAAEAATRRGDWEVAAERWFGVWQATRDGRAALEAGRALLATGDAASALSLLRQARGSDDAVIADAALGLELEALTRLGRIDEADRLLEAALAVAPGPKHLARLADLRLERGEERAALPPLRRAVAAGTAGPEARRELARLESRLGSAQAAFSLWVDEDLRGAPDDLVLAARSALDPGVDQVAQAVEWLERARELEPQAVDVHLALSRAFLRASDVEEALASASRAVELDPTRTDALEVLLRLRLARGTEADRERAARLVERASLLEPTRAAEFEALLAPATGGEPANGDGGG